MAGDAPLLRADAPGAPAAGVAPTAPTAPAAPAARAPFVPPWLVPLAVVLQVGDLASAALAIGARGLGAELNPLACAAYEAGGAPALAGLKLLMAAAIAGALRDARREGRPGLARAVLAIAAGAGALGWWSNLPLAP